MTILAINNKFLKVTSTAILVKLLNASIIVNAKSQFNATKFPERGRVEKFL